MEGWFAGVALSMFAIMVLTALVGFGLIFHAILDNLWRSYKRKKH